MSVIDSLFVDAAVDVDEVSSELAVLLHTVVL